MPTFESKYPFSEDDEVILPALPMTSGDEESRSSTRSENFSEFCPGLIIIFTAMFV